MIPNTFDTSEAEEEAKAIYHYFWLIVGNSIYQNEPTKVYFLNHNIPDSVIQICNKIAKQINCGPLPKNK